MAYIITGFHLQSDANSTGVEIGDRIIGIDGFDIRDESLLQHFITIQPGEKIILII